MSIVKCVLKVLLTVDIVSYRPEGNSLVGSYTIMAMGTIQPKNSGNF